jgi:predicted glycosyltransferase involved in capsule biosynthesis
MGDSEVCSGLKLKYLLKDVMKSGKLTRFVGEGAEDLSFLKARDKTRKPKPKLENQKIYPTIFKFHTLVNQRNYQLSVY